MAESGEEWELSKENIRPIQQGRRQKVLKVALAPHPEELISQQRQSFENELRTYSGDDPLFVWCKYIKWVEQNYPKGGREGHIKQLMEHCLSIFKDEQKYFDDDRFIDIMLKYASLSGKPLEVYNYMYSNNIGCKSAKFFISWSWELEEIGSIKKADDVLTEGMQRKAQPFEKMKSYHADFEIRLATKIKESVETNSYDSENSRSAFSVLKPQKKNLAPILRTGEAVIEKKSSLTLNRQQPQPKNIKTSSKIPFKIYNSENINPFLPVQIQSGARNSLNPENFKENELKPSKWNKVKMKSHNLFHETNPDFKFHCDDEKDDQVCTPRSVPKTSTILSSRRRTPSPPIALFEPPDPKKKPMYPKNKVYGGAEEYSLEEIRAAEWLERKKKAEKDRLLVEQQKRIEEQAKNEELLKKQVEFLSKQIEMLQSCSNSKPCVSSNLNEVFKTDKASKECNDLPFEFFHDPTNAISNVADTTSENKNCRDHLYQELPDEDDENIPPKGYIQDNTKRELAGILEPSKNILFIPLDEQQLEEEDDEESDFEEDYIYQQGQKCADETLIPPSNTEQFSTAKFLASTPCINKPNKKTRLDASNQISLKHISQNSSNPSETLSGKIRILGDENTEIKQELKSHKELGPNSDLKNTCHSRLPNILSVIMETSENYSKSSSSNSSASLTKSNHLDQNSVYHLNLHKHSKLESGEKSISGKISENSIQSAKSCLTIDLKDKINQGKCIEDSDPFDPEKIQSFLKTIKLDHYKNIFKSNQSIHSVKDHEYIQIGDKKYQIENQISEGAYAKVYKAVTLIKDLSDKPEPVALKVCKKANEWEFYICSEIQRRLSEKNLIPDIKDSVMNIIAAIKYVNGIVLVSEYSPLGTLLEIINFYKKQNSPVPELICMFFTLQILQIVSKLHECNVIHGDIKPDNFLLISIYPDGDILDNMTRSTSCLRLIDFGRAIDLNLYDKGVCFTSTLTKNDFKCNEMKDGKPWVFQLDWYGVLSCVHTLLFQEYMKVTKKDGTWKIEKKFKRYWFNSLWEPLFSQLLNIPACYEEPDIKFFRDMIVSKLQQNASNFISQLSRFSDVYWNNKRK